MDHNDAVRLQAAEKYVLGELSPALRDEYEEHYFDCLECAKDLHAAASFVDNAREVLRQQPAESFARDPDLGRRGWFAWLLRPALALPAFAALLLVVAYQNIVTIPRAKEEATRAAAQIFTSSFSLQMANVRGGDEVKIQVHPREIFALKFDFTPSQSFDSYICQLVDEAGRSLLQASIPGIAANKEAQLVIPGGLVHPGKYSLVFTGGPGSKGQAAGDEVLRLSFAIEFLQ